MTKPDCACQWSCFRAYCIAESKTKEMEKILVSVLIFLVWPSGNF